MRTRYIILSECSATANAELPTGGDARLRVKRLENKDLIWHLLCSVIPLVAWIVEYVERLANKVRIDDVGRNKIGLRERTGVHHPKRPVFYGAKEGPPNTATRSEHVVFTRKTPMHVLQDLVTPVRQPSVFSESEMLF
jgi:hypothetical protein